MDAMIHAHAPAAVDVAARSRLETFRIAKPQKAFAAAFAVFATALAGCASGLGANTYEASRVGRIARVEEGTIVAARPIMIEGSQQNAKVGTLAGAVLGGLAGSELGGGHKANTAGAVGGAILGGVAGNAIGKSAGSQPGFAYTIRLPSGELVSVAQAGEFAMPSGTPVLIEYGARARVVPQNMAYGY
jgi:outer membrane lipoprotein SlyB